MGALKSSIVRAIVACVLEGPTPLAAARAATWLRELAAASRRT